MIKTEPYTFELTDWTAGCEALYEIRRSVLIDELGVPPEREQQQDDAPALHLLARDHDGRPIGCGRLLIDGQIGRIGRLAVIASQRRRGLGAALLTRLLAIAAERELTELTLSSPQQRLGFFRRFGFAERTAPDTHDDDQHRILYRRLTDRRADELPLEARELHGCEDSLQATLALIAASRKRLAVYSPYLHPQLYGAPELALALQRKLHQQPQIQIRLLLPPVADWRRRCPLLAAQLQRAGALALRRWPAALARTSVAGEISSAVWLGDDSLLQHHQPHSAQGVYQPFGGQRAAELWSFFEHCWSRAEADEELRGLAL